MLSRSELMVFINRVSFSMSVTSAFRLSWTKRLDGADRVRDGRAAPSGSRRARETSWRRDAGQVRMNARTSSSFSASVLVKLREARSTVSNSGPLPSPNVAAAAESCRIISLPRAPLPSSALAPASSRWSSVPSLLTPLGPSASDRSRRLA